MDPSDHPASPLTAQQTMVQSYPVYSLEEAFTHITRQRSREDQELYIFTDEVLFKVWDALCLSLNDEYREEYLPYLPHVFDLLKTRENGAEILDYLLFIEEDKYGTTKNDILAQRRAERVVNILLEYRGMIEKQAKAD